MNTTAKTLSALLLGAALITPALAQDATSANNGNSATAQNAPQTAPMADSAAPSAAPTTPVQSGNADGTVASNTSNAMPASNNTQTAMNTTGSASDLSSVPDTQKKYSRSNRARDYKKEASVTAQLNQKESSLNGASGQSQQ